ncbi:hypothetical protein HDU96_001219, partial [Phlyctochytrium bullatum]
MSDPGTSTNGMDGLALVVAAVAMADGAAGDAPLSPPPPPGGNGAADAAGGGGGGDAGDGHSGGEARRGSGDGGDGGAGKGNPGKGAAGASGNGRAPRRRVIPVRRLSALPSQLKLEDRVRREILDMLAERGRITGGAGFSGAPNRAAAAAAAAGVVSSADRLWPAPLADDPIAAFPVLAPTSSSLAPAVPGVGYFDHLDFQLHGAAFRDAWLEANRFRREDLGARENRWRTVDRHAGASTQLIVFQCKCGIPGRQAAAAAVPTVEKRRKEGGTGGRRPFGGVRTYPYVACKAFVHMTCNSEGVALVVRGIFEHSPQCNATKPLAPARPVLHPEMEKHALSQLERNVPLRAVLEDNRRRAKALGIDNNNDAPEEPPKSLSPPPPPPPPPPAPPTQPSDEDPPGSGEDGEDGPPPRVLLTRGDVRNLRRALLRRRPELKRGRAKPKSAGTPKKPRHPTRSDDDDDEDDEDELSDDEPPPPAPPPHKRLLPTDDDAPPRAERYKRRCERVEVWPDEDVVAADAKPLAPLGPPGPLGPQSPPTPRRASGGPVPHPQGGWWHDAAVREWRADVGPVEPWGRPPPPQAWQDAPPPAPYNPPPPTWARASPPPHAWARGPAAPPPPQPPAPPSTRHPRTSWRASGSPAAARPAPPSPPTWPAWQPHPLHLRGGEWERPPPPPPTAAHDGYWGGGYPPPPAARSHAVWRDAPQHPHHHEDPRGGYAPPPPPPQAWPSWSHDTRRPPYWAYPPPPPPEKKDDGFRRAVEWEAGTARWPEGEAATAEGAGWGYGGYPQQGGAGQQVGMGWRGYAGEEYREYEEGGEGKGWMDV